MSETRPADPFDELLSLEEQYYQEGHALGVQDGSRSGRIEGRVFGLEKGFEKFAAMGALAGQCAVWEARLSEPQASKPGNVTNAGGHGEERARVDTIPSNSRLRKHLNTLFALTEAASLSTQNNEDAVSEFDDRLKRAEGKAKVISSIVGVSSSVPREDAGPAKAKANKGDGSIEDFSVPQRSRVS